MGYVRLFLLRVFFAYLFYFNKKQVKKEKLENKTERNDAYKTRSQDITGYLSKAGQISMAS